MRRNSFSKKIIAYEIIAFSIITVFLWLDEFLDIPHHVLGAQKTPINTWESVLETGVTLILGSLVILMTHKLLKKIDSLLNDIKKHEEELEKLNANKDKLFSIISHDLKTPFTSLFNSAKLLSKNINKLSAEELREFIEIICRSTKRLVDLLENLLRWAKTQAKTFEYNPQRLELAWLINYNIDLLAENAGNKKIRLINKIRQDICVYADRFMLNSVIQNLISNAVKFTRENGEITITSQIKDKNTVEVSVADTGIGMDEETLTRLFKIAATYSQKGTHGEKGTGLGLILCKEFIAKTGGKIHVESAPAKGSTFKFTLPRAD